MINNTSPYRVLVTRRLPLAALKELQAACDVDLWDHETPPAYETLRAHLGDKHGLLCLLTDRIDADLLSAAPELRVISQCAVGYDNIDLQAAARRKIVVGNTPGVLTEATADFAFTLLLAAARRLGEALEFVRAGKWETWGLTLLLGQEVHGATLGIIGMGRIGQAVARRASGFAMHILYHDHNRAPTVEREFGARYCSLNELLEQSDFVTLHVNLNPETRGLIGAEALARMKSSAVLINTARGPVVDTQALYQALRRGQIAYAALDVTDPEPLRHDHELLTLPNVLVVPHIASATTQTRTRMAQMAVQNLIAGLQGRELPYPVQLPRG